MLNNTKILVRFLGGLGITMILGFGLAFPFLLAQTRSLIHRAETNQLESLHKAFVDQMSTRASPATTRAPRSESRLARARNAAENWASAMPPIRAMVLVRWDSSSS